MRTRVGAVLVALSMVIGLQMTAAPAEAATKCRYQTLRWGSTGTCVRYAQTMFNAMAADKGLWAGNRYAGGYIITVDGIDGRNTTNQAYAAQRWFNSWHAYKVSVDGVIGPQTWDILCSYAWRNNLTNSWASRANAAGNIACQW